MYESKTDISFAQAPVVDSKKYTYTQGSAEDEIWGYSHVKIEILPLETAERG